jgi:hypothetical protein
LRQLSAVSSPPDFQHVMMLAAQRTRKLLNQTDLAHDATLSHPDGAPVFEPVGNWLSGYTRPATTNPSAALVKATKLLWTDCGLAAWLAGIKSSADATQRLDAAVWLEQTLFQTLDSWRALDSNGASCIFGGTVRGTKWIPSWKKSASWSRWKLKRAVR